MTLNSLRIDREAFAIKDIDRPLTFLTVYDAPFELSDLAIMKRLSPFCEVVNYRRGRFDFMPDVYNGLRHYFVIKGDRSLFNDVHILKHGVRSKAHFTSNTFAITGTNAVNGKWMLSPSVHYI